MEDKSLKEKTARGLMWSSIGNSAQLVLGALFGIFLARLLSPSDYGMVGLLQVFIVIAGTLQDSGLRIALANRKEVRHEDYNAVFWFNIIVSSSLYVVLFFLAPFITEFYQQSDAAAGQDLSKLTPLARFSFLGFVTASLGTAHCAYLFRTLQVKPKAIITITSLCVSCLTGISMAYLGFAYWGLATQGVVYTVSNTILFWYFSKWRPTLPVSFRPLKEMFGFSCKLLATDIFNSINSNILSVMLGRFYSVKSVGFYNQANKWTYMGSNWMVGTVREVAQPVLRNVSDDRERHRHVFRKMLRFTAFITFPAMFGLAFISRELILITVTDKWLESVPLMQILSACAFTFPIQFLCQNLVITKERSDLVMWNTIALGAAQIGIVFFTYPHGIRTMVCAYASINILWFFVWFYFVHREIGLRLREALLDLAPYAVIAALSMAVTYFVIRPVENVYQLFALKIIVAASVYALLMWLCGSATFKECIGFLLKKHTPGK
ncbi:MAG: lipopolysaccharide biosynthesis protein [Paraprevotella sp.]|nr:lipopolysaccharide biosynthesis protein [Paraprevotella sp.]